MILFRRFAFPTFIPVGLCNFKLSPLVGGLISFIFFFAVPWPFRLPFMLGVVGGVVCCLWLLDNDSLSDSCFPIRVCVSLVQYVVGIYDAQILPDAVAVQPNSGSFWYLGGV